MAAIWHIIYIQSNVNLQQYDICEAPPFSEIENISACKINKDSFLRNDFNTHLFDPISEMFRYFFHSNLKSFSSLKNVYNNYLNNVELQVKFI